MYDASWFRPASDGITPHFAVIPIVAAKLLFGDERTDALWADRKRNAAVQAVPWLHADMTIS
jgi:hypothetical protein